jgi:putative ubiquitin-RnfH superfamily antitoxin RatB of RatAB toxin-antitoxin module
VASQGAIRVEVVYALPERQELVVLEVEEGATVGEVIERSGLAALFPGHDLERTPVGIWGRVVERDARVSDGDRVEIYRPLHKDPRALRRERATKPS